jgi:hypothetical protein
VVESSCTGGLLVVAVDAAGVVLRAEGSVWPRLSPGEHPGILDKGID